MTLCSEFKGFRRAFRLSLVDGWQSWARRTLGLLETSSAKYPHKAEEMQCHLGTALSHHYHHQLSLTDSPLAYGDLIDWHLVPILAGFVIPIQDHQNNKKSNIGLVGCWWLQERLIGWSPFRIPVVDHLPLFYGKGTYSHAFSTLTIHILWITKTDFGIFLLKPNNIFESKRLHTTY